MNNYEIHPFDAFDSHRSGYKAVNGWAMAWASNLAYRTKQQIETSFENFSLKNDCKTKFIQRPSGAEVAVISTPKFIVIAIRGTEDLLDVRTDARAWLSEHRGGGGVHNGFLLQLNSVWDELSKFVCAETSVVPGKKLWITGHSLGGGIAVIAATRFLDVNQCEFTNQFQFGQLYTFGQPRVGDREFIEYAIPLLAGKYYRGVKANDLVANGLPPNIVYRHFGVERYIKRSGKIHVAVRRATKYWARKMGLLSFFFNLLPSLIFDRAFHLFYDHDLDNYEKHFFHSYRNAVKRLVSRKK